MEQTKDNFKVSFDFVKTPITQIADYIIISASKHNTSDIHFDPRESGMMVRFRIDGDLQDYSFIPKAYERNLTTRLKLLANMNITESRLPQDGAIKGVFGDTYLDMRVSCLPLNEGEKIVIRILDYTRSLQGIDSLGFHPDNMAKLKRMMMAPNGIILVTGATGSGKSTTTYSILQGLNTPETNIITVEDPIEMNIQGINQVQVNSEIGMTFAAALRSILRQDPNVILIGEIRDSETAQIAVRSAITGHLVLSTIHTNNSLSTIERLLDMDVERYLLSTALTGIISQRLAKAICSECRFQRKTTPYEQKIFRNFLQLDVKTIWDANPNGCSNCRKGYKGRIAIQEVLELDDDIRGALINDKLSKDELRSMVYTNKTITMLQDALIKCINGETSFEEVYRVIEMENVDGEDYKSELTAAIDEAFAPPAPAPVVSEEIIENTVQEQPQTIVDTAPEVIQSEVPVVENNVENTVPEISNDEIASEQPVLEVIPNTDTIENQIEGTTADQEVENTTQVDIPIVDQAVEGTTQVDIPITDEAAENTVQIDIPTAEQVIEDIPQDDTSTTEQTIDDSATNSTNNTIIELPNIIDNLQQPQPAVIEQQTIIDNNNSNGDVISINDNIVDEEKTSDINNEVSDEQLVIPTIISPEDVNNTIHNTPHSINNNIVMQVPDSTDLEEENLATISPETIEDTINQIPEGVLIDDNGYIFTNDTDNNVDNNATSISFEDIQDTIQVLSEEPVLDDVIVVPETPASTDNVDIDEGEEYVDKDEETTPRELIGASSIDPSRPLLEQLPINDGVPTLKFK